jgi:hypothetical protein
MDNSSFLGFDDEYITIYNLNYSKC